MLNTSEHNTKALKAIATEKERRKMRQQFYTTRQVSRSAAAAAASCLTGVGTGPSLVACIGLLLEKRVRMSQLLNGN
jgi:hypothetical protein